MSSCCFLYFVAPLVFVPVFGDEWPLCVNDSRRLFGPRSLFYLDKILRRHLKAEQKSFVWNLLNVFK